MACLSKDLISSLIERAWDLHGKLNFEIETSVKFCRFCSEHGRYCDIADQTTFEDRRTLIAARDLVKQVENTLLSLQKLRSWQLRERHEALTLLGESRLVLMELVRSYKGRPLDVVRELNACFGDENCAVLRRVDGSDLRKKWPALICDIIRKVFIKWKWRKAVVFAMKFLIFTTSISSMVHLNHTRNSSSGSSRKVLSILDSTEAETRESLLSISRSPLNVFHGRG